LNAQERRMIRPRERDSTGCNWNAGVLELSEMSLGGGP
jgi:hypothetical protein